MLFKDESTTAAEGILASHAPRRITWHVAGESSYGPRAYNGKGRIMDNG